jgi:hypothetical protein
MDKEEERRAAVRKAVRDVLMNASGILAALAVLRSRAVAERWFLIAVASMYRFYFLVSGVEAGYRLHLALFSIKAPVCFDAPWNSLTIAEFWGKRWNLSIAQQLRNVFYKPILQVSGNKRLAALATFIASSGLHMIPIVSLGGSKKAVATTALFFLVQPLLMAVESAFHIKSKLWVHGALWAVAPLFSLPLHEVV